MRTQNTIGAQLAAEVKNDPGFAHIPIIAQTVDVDTSGNFDIPHFDAKRLPSPKTRATSRSIFIDGKAG